MDQRAQKAADAEADRKRKGLLTGREIFSQVPNSRLVLAPCVVQGLTELACFYLHHVQPGEVQVISLGPTYLQVSAPCGNIRGHYPRQTYIVLQISCQVVRPHRLTDSVTSSSRLFTSHSHNFILWTLLFIHLSFAHTLHALCYLLSCDLCSI